MHILHVVASYLPATRYGGTLYSVHGMARAQARRGDDVHVFTTNVDGSGVSPVPLGTPVDLEGVKVWYFPCSAGRRLYRSPAMARALAERVNGFDILHLHSAFLWPTLAAARAAQRARVPYVLAPHGMLVADLIRRKSSLVKRAWLTLFERSNIKYAAAVHLTSEIEASEFERLGLGARHIAVVPNGVDLPAFGPMPPAAARPFVLSLGRVNWKKGLDRLIAAMVHVPTADLVIAGNDEENYTRKLDAIVENCGLGGRVRFVGPVHGDDKWTLIRSAAVFALASHSENFGIAVLEAMACEVPVVVTLEVGLAADVAATSSGLVTAGTPEELGEALAGLIANPERRKAMGEAGGIAAKERFSWPIIASRMQRVYQEAMLTSPRDAQKRGDNSSSNRDGAPLARRQG